MRGATSTPPAPHTPVRQSIRLALPVLSVALLAPAASAVSIVDPGFGPFFFSGGPTELSGITRMAGNEYLAVSDSGGQLVSLTVLVQSATGAVTSALAGTPVALAGGVDLEGVAFDPGTGQVFVSDEVGPAIRGHDPATGVFQFAITVPAIYGQARTNRSLESLTLDPAGGGLWTANEEALDTDGPVSTLVSGTVIRLQRFDSSFSPDGQWAYVTDAIPDGPAGGDETSGVVDLLALPAGELLVLERSLGQTAFRSRIYLVDRTGATDTSGLAALDSDPFVAVQKTLLWEAAPLFSNFEGITLGPELDAGDRSLLLVSDDGGLFGQALYPLRISLPEPGTAALLVTGLCMLGLRGRARTGRERPGCLRSR